jgi:hypothetical protein
VDKLFKEKLETHTLQPSAQAWEKVESHLSKKNKMVVWLRVAAVIALLTAVTVVVVNINDPEKQIAKDKIKTESAPKEEQTIIPEQKEEAPQQVVRTNPLPKKKDKQMQKPAPVEIQEEQRTEEQVAITEEPAPVIEEAPREEVPQQVNNVEKPITLVYSLPSVKKEEKLAEPAVATVDEPKKTGFERVLEIASDVKNADNPLAELREAKDNILAFEFKKDKDKTKKQN